MESIFVFIDQFKPETFDLEPVLKPFLPDYIPAIGDLEAMIKIPPPIIFHECI
jgi:intraflagellar transport protein 46